MNVHARRRARFVYLYPLRHEKASQAVSVYREYLRESAGFAAHTLEDVVAALRFYTDLGFNHLVLHGPGHDQERFLRTLSEQVLPGLRELVPADPAVG